MILKLNNGKEYMVHWKHTYPKEAKMSSLILNRGGTSCFIYELHGQEDKELLVLVNLRRYYKDQFCKEAGRKYSLTKALSAAKFSKEQRTQFWRAYFDRVKTPVAI